MSPTGVDLPRRGPWWLVAVVLPFALWSGVTDGQTAWTRVDAGRRVVEVAAIGLKSLGAVVALRQPAVGAAMTSVGCFAVVTEIVPSAPVFFLFCALVVVFTGSRTVLLALDAALVLWCVTNLAARGTDFVIVHVGAVALVAGFTAVRLRLESLGRAAERDRDRAERAVLAADEAEGRERARLARDLHDVVAHDVTVMAMQCDAALLSEDPAVREQALVAVSSAAHRSLADLRRMMKVLTLVEGDVPGAAAPVDLGAELVAVASRLRGLGLDVQTRLEVQPSTTISPAVRVALVPVLRETATNVAKYADPDVPVSFEVEVELDRAAIRVENGRRSGAVGQASADPTTTGRFGLLSLAERIRALDGTFHAAAEGDRWVVSAEVPTDQPAAGRF